MAEILLTEQNFSTEVLQTKQPMLVDFYADWCGPCQALAPILRQIAQTETVGKVDVDAQPALAARYGVSSVPTVLVFSGGQVRDTAVGLHSQAALEEMLHRAK